MRVRHLLMELNRAVCLDHPEANIPWFHEKYCEEFLETGESYYYIITEIQERPSRETTHVTGDPKRMSTIKEDGSKVGRIKKKQVRDENNT